MAHLAGRISVCWIVALALMAGLLGAWTTETGVVTTASVPATQTVTYQGGQYRLYGSGTATSPFYWVWVPSGVTAPAPPTTTAASTVAYPGGRYQLQGNGTVASPRYWVWVPTGSTVEAIVPAPPPLPVTQTVQTTVQPAGQYQL